MRLGHAFLSVLLAIIFTGFAAELRADDTAYLTTGAAEFGTIDLTTGVFSSIGLLGFTSSGLGSYNGTIYAATYQSAAGKIYTINPATAVATQLGAASNIDYYDLGSTLTGLYALDTSLNLYSINPTTGVPTLIGPTGGPVSSWYGFSTNSATLYATFGSNLYTLNTTTGAATLVGATGGTQYGALVTVNGTLYAGQDANAHSVDTLNPSTGAATLGPALTGTNSNFFGLATTPEPTALAAFGMIGFALCRRRSMSATDAVSN